MMDVEHWRQVDALLQAALEREPAERDSFLEEACSGDENLKKEVQSLLSSGEHALSIMDTPAFESAAALLSEHIPELAEGEIISHYRILSFLSSGGMGEVYLAEDTKLGRKIALKLLPADFTKDRNRVRRFQQEARATSALNHPNIITIHETGEFQDRHFIASEFIEGETLRQRLKRTTLDLGETLDMAIQVGNALVAAHQAGIIHRDIKPENIMLRPDGFVKVLDFGLAKLSEQSSSDDSSPILNQTDTLPGLLMGTAKYMSPEQARGLSLDGRSDLFSLSAVIYEMLAGRAPFEGKTNSDVIAALLKEEPAPLSQYISDLPVEVEQIISKALAKNREQRYQTVNDLLAVLKELRRELEIGQGLNLKRAEVSEGILTASDTSSNLSITQQVTSLLRRHKLKVVLTLLIVIIAAGGFFYGSKKFWRTRAAFQEVKMTQLAETDKSLSAAISPDGSYLAYTVLGEKYNQSLLLRHLATNSITVLVPPRRIWYNGLTFSRDGNYIYYCMTDNEDLPPTLYRVSTSGGDSEKVLERVESLITFSPDGKRFAFVRYITENETGLFIANTDGTEERLLDSRRYPSAFSSVSLSWSPDGKLIACVVSDQASANMVTGVGVEDGSEKLLSAAKWSKVQQVTWLADNSGLIMVAKGQGEGLLLWYVSYPEGDSRRITNDPTNFPEYTSISLTADSRMLAVSRYEARGNLWTAPSGNPTEMKQITLGGNHHYLQVAWTPDGKIVFPSDAGGGRELWIMEGDETGQKQLSADGHCNTFPAVSPDGRYILTSQGAVSEESRHIWRMNIDGSDPIQLTRGEDDLVPQCSPDSRWVLYTSNGTIWRVSIDGGEPIRVTNGQADCPVVSPDGKLIACWWRSPPNNNKIAIIPFAGGEPIKFIDLLPGTSKAPPFLRWTADGQSLLCRVERNGTSNIWSQPINSGTPKQLTDFKSELIISFDLSRDDKLLLSRGFLAHEIVLIQDLNR